MTDTIDDGYYWIFFEDGEPEVVEIITGDMYRCGSDVSCRLNDNGQWVEFEEPMGVTSIIGPLIPPQNE